MNTATAIQLRPVCARDFPILRRLNSPIWQRIQNPGSVETPHTATEAVEMVFQFSRPVRVVEQTLDRGRGHFRFVAAREIQTSDDEARALIDQIQAAIVAFGESFGGKM